MQIIPVAIMDSYDNFVKGKQWKMGNGKYGEMTQSCPHIS